MAESPLIGLLLRAASEGGDKEKMGPSKAPMQHESRTHAARAAMGAIKRGDVDAFDMAMRAYVDCCKQEDGDTEDETFAPGGR